MKKLFVYCIVCLFCFPGFLQAEKCNVQRFSEMMGKLGFKELNIRTDVPRKRIVSADKQVEDYDEKQVFYSRLRSYELSNFDYLLSKLPDIGKASQEERSKKMGVAMKRSIYVEILEYPNKEIAIRAYDLWGQKNNHSGMVGEYFVGSPDESLSLKL